MRHTNYSWLLLGASFFACVHSTPTAVEPEPIISQKREIHLDHDPSESVRPTEWGYHDSLAPEHWASLSHSYETCLTGKMQSPVDIDTSRAATVSRGHTVAYEESDLTVAHHAQVHDILDNGHTIQVDIDEGSVLKTLRETYHLKQFHFHSPSENRIDGKTYPLEAHFVHQSDSGQLAVISAFYEEGAHHAQLEKIIEHFPSEKGKLTILEDESIDPNLHLPSNHDAYHFYGSLTTPPCTEGVEWLILKEVSQASSAQIKTFSERLHHNNRPVQAWNDRRLIVDTVEEDPPAAMAGVTPKPN